MTAFSAAEPVKVWVLLRDKGPAVSPARGERAYENAPVYGPYLERLRGAGFAVSIALKWQNRVSGWAEPSALPALAALPFVTGVEGMPRKAPEPRPKASSKVPLSKSSAVLGLFDSLFIKLGAAELRDTVLARGLRPGEGLRIAQMDQDFHLGNQAFDSLFALDLIADQWDFVSNDAQAVDRLIGESHGGTVLSPMAANLPQVAVGLAPYAHYLLYRTENGPSERWVEEDYLAAAFERAVDSGAQIINVSLGYRYDFNAPDTEYPYAMMDGRTRPSSIAAAGAARRGTLVIVAIGNEGGARGNPATPTVTAPSDADSIVSVGMVTRARARCGYSSTGPSFDGRLKPEISSLGPGSGCTMAVVDPDAATGGYNEAGTSVGAPVITGIAALLRQLHPDSTVSAQKIRQALLVTAERSDSADNLRGNGLARAGQAHCALRLDSLVHTPCGPAAPPIGVKGIHVWRGGNLSTLPWPNGLDLDRIRMWDLKGRKIPLSGQLDEEGDVLLQSRKRLAPGTFILKIPQDEPAP
jgi:serine protease AprX